MMLETRLISLLKKLVPISENELGKYRFNLFGSGGFTKNILNQYESNVVNMIEYPRTVAKLPENHLNKPWITPDEVSGTVVLGTGNGSYQFNQLKALSEADEGNIDRVLLVDPYLSQRNIESFIPGKSVVFLEHADGVERHQHHLKSLKAYFEKNGSPTVTLCPLTLFYYEHLTDCRDVLVFNGQRPLYDIARHVFSYRKLTFIEYGFFPQRDYVYLDKVGVNHQCSLMYDGLDWIDDVHLQKVKDIRGHFLSGFRHKSKDYVLVPLQVPDDVNIQHCSRFTNGMQEFIDYIIDFYPPQQQIVFKAHPKDPYKDSYDYRGKSVSDAPFVKLMEHAKCVHGITSSTLFEAALAGVEILAEGISILKEHSHQTEKLFAAMIDRQIHVDNENPEYWLRKYSNVTIAE